MKTKLQNGQKLAPQFRNMQFRAEALDEENFVLKDVSVSSDEPYERYYGTEILKHEDGCVDLSRIRKGASPVLFNHDRDFSIGKVMNPRLENGRLIVDFKFTRGDRAKEIIQDVKDGILTECSIGYSIEKFEVDEKEETYTATRWRIFEASLVTIPADFTVGVGRASDSPEGEILTIEKKDIAKSLKNENNPIKKQEQSMSEPATTQPTEPKLDENKLREEGRLAEQKRVTEINERVTMWRTKGFAGRKIDASEIAAKAIAEGKTVQEFKDLVIEAALPEVRESTTGAPGSGIEVIGELGAGPRNGSQARTPGEMLTESKEFREFAKDGIRNKRSLVLELPKADLTRATLLTSTGPFTNYARPDGVVMVEQRRLTVRDLLSVGQTTANQIRYTREDTYTNAATSVAEEGLKPEASFDLSEVTADVTKIAVIGRVSKESFDDFPYLRSYVDGRLRYMVEQEEEDELLTGDGSGSDLVGLLETPNIQTQSAAVDPLDAILRAITKIREVGFYEPDGVVMNPTDYQTFRLMKDANNQYYGGGPFSGQYGNGGVMLMPPIWGLPVVVTSAISQGTALVGAFKRGAQIWDREGLQIDTTETDGEDWRYNRIAIRLEKRLALTVYRPLAFCEVTGIA